MWISIRTKHVRISTRMRLKIEAFVRRALQRERRYIGSVVVGIEPAQLGRELSFDCRITVWSHHLGLLVANDVGGTIRTAVQQTVLRAREAFRRQLHKRRTIARRNSRSRVSRWLPTATAH
jgi:ribosome-associated translation inhibitor RaiA